MKFNMVFEFLLCYHLNLLPFCMVKIIIAFKKNCVAHLVASTA